MTRKNKVAKCDKDIKVFYYLEVAKMLIRISNFKDMEARATRLKQYIKTEATTFELIILAHYLKRVLYDDSPNTYFIDQADNIQLELLTKVNIAELVFSAEMLGEMSEVEQLVKNFLYSFSGDLFFLFSSYFQAKNVLGIRAKALEQIYVQFKMAKYLIQPQLSDFGNPIITTTKVKKDKNALLFPALVLRSETNEVYHYYKVGEKIKSNLPTDILDKFNIVFSAYKKLGLLGVIENNVFRLALCTGKLNVIDKLIAGQSVRNNFKYLLDIFNVVERSVEAFRNTFRLPILEKWDGDLINSIFELIENHNFNTSLILFRNKFLPINTSKIEQYIVTEVDIINRKVVGVTSVGKSAEIVLEDLVNNPFAKLGKVKFPKVGDKVKVLYLNKLMLMSEK